MEQDIWSPTERAVADVLSEAGCLPYGARINAIWNENRTREENITALQAADRDADAANRAFVRRLIAAATR